MVHCHSYTTPTKDQYIHYHCIPVSNGSRLLIMFMFNVTHCGIHFFPLSTSMKGKKRMVYQQKKKSKDKYQLDRENIVMH